jgi:predicted esterase
MERKTIEIVANYQLETIVRKVDSPKFMILLLHGYAQKASFIYRKIINFLPIDAEVHAPTAPFPLLSNHPLQERPKNRQLVAGYAWYFYDAVMDYFYIPYKIPVQILNNYLKINNPCRLPIVVIGYSQGGYLLPFLSLENELINHIIGINCSYRVDLINRDLEVKADAINGEQDEMVDPYLAGKRQQQLFGEFILLPEQGHRLTANFGTEVARLLKQSPCLD